MALQLNDLLMRLQPPSAQNMGMGDDKSIERQQLKLMREKFENEKDQQQRQLELNRLEESGRMAREQMVQQRMAAEKDAERQAAAEQKKNEAIALFTKTAGSGDVQGAHAMLPMLTHLGVPVSLEGEENGLPRYRIGPDPEAQQRSQGAIGYPTDDSGTLNEGSGIASSSDMTPEQIARVTGGGTEDRAATEKATAQPPLAVEPDIGPPAPGDDTDANPIKPEYRQAVDSLDPLAGIRPARMAAAPPAQPDYTGAVPKNVLDMGAIHQQTLASLNPALNSIVGSYPTEYQDSAAQSADAVRSLALPAAQSVEMLDKLRSSPDSIIRANIAADAQRTDSKSKADVASGEREQKYILQGNNFAEKISKDFDIKGVKTRRKSLDQVVEVLTNKNPQDDYLAGASVSRLMGERGATTEPDIERALGTASASFFERIKQGLYKEAIGGLSDPQKDALMGVIKKARESDQKGVNDYLDNVEEQASSPNTHPDVARGMRSYRDAVVPKAWRDEYNASKKKKPDAAAGQAQASNEGDLYTAPPGATARNETPADADFEDELMAQAADAGFDERAVRGVINVESGGNPAAHNDSGATGLIQFMPAIAKAMGTSTEEIGKMTKAQQVQYVIKYLKDRDIDENSTQADMYAAIAAGGRLKDGSYVWQKPDDYVVYPKGSPGWEQNKPWRPADGGDITIGTIKAFGGGKPDKPTTTLTSADSDLSGRLDAMKQRLGR